MATTARGQAHSKLMYFISNPKVRNEKKQSFLTGRLEIQRNILIDYKKQRFFDFDFFPTGYRRGRRGVAGGGWMALLELEYKRANMYASACKHVRMQACKHVNMHACQRVNT